MNRIEKINELEKLIKHFKNNLESYKKNNLNEQMTRQQYIDTFLKILGWDVSNPLGFEYNEREVVVEEYSTSNAKDRPDYTIRFNGVSKFYIEAKKVNVDIYRDKAAALQTRRYGWNAGHEITILTNFEYLSIYMTHSMPNETEIASSYRYRVYHYEEYINLFDEIYEMLSRDSMVNGKFEQWTNDIKPDDAMRTSLDNVFLSQLNKWRLSIATDLYEKNTHITDYGNLNLLIQVFLNQIIFLRFAEDNRFENVYLLKNEILKYDNYIEYFKLLDSKYNSDLFVEPLVINLVSNEILSDIVENLYFPNVSYDFSIIDIAILSKIYEKFLQEEIVVKDGEVYIEKTKDAKIKAIVSTPDDLVIAMVHRIMKKILSGKTPEDIIKLKICDLAVGSGIFLIEVYNYIEDYLIEWYSKEKKSIPKNDVVPFKIKRKIIENVFWGFDTNVQAIQITRFSLILRLLSNEHKERIENISPILPSLSNRIIAGNSLVDDEAIDIVELDEKTIFDILPLEKSVLNDMKFDLILGNPPYLKIEDIKKTTHKVEVDIYKEKYKSAYKQYDKYFLFIEKSLQLLKENGEGILLVPNKFFTNGSGLNLRKVIKNHIYKIFDFSATQVFNDVSNYVSVIQFNNTNNELLSYTKVNKINDIYMDKIGVSHDKKNLKEKHWFLSDDELFLKNYQYAAMNFPNILEEVDTINGIQTSKNKVYVLDKRNIVAETEYNVKFKVEDEEFTIEKDLLRDFYKPSMTTVGKSYQNLNSDKYVIFPYIDGRVILEEVMKTKYSRTWKYLNGHKAELLPRVMGGNRDVIGSDKNIIWYQYGRTQYLTAANTNKILVGVMSKCPNFNIDRKRFTFASGGTAGYIGIFLKNNSQYSLEYIEAWLSHEFTDKIFRTIGSDFEGGFYTHGTNMYDAIPLLPIDFTSEIEMDIYNKINKYVEKITLLNNKIDFEKNSQLKNIEMRKKEKLIEKINKLIDKLIEIKMVI